MPRAPRGTGGRSPGAFWGLFRGEKSPAGGKQAHDARALPSNRPACGGFGPMKASALAGTPLSHAVGMTAPLKGSLWLVHSAEARCALSTMESKAGTSAASVRKPPDKRTADSRPYCEDGSLMGGRGRCLHRPAPHQRPLVKRGVVAQGRCVYRASKAPLCKGGCQPPG